ncbi:hypothetical protein B0H11DRAFT_2050142 [Mycena galericulata]|nr:hypothetical protein B0H11DRAFT_2050142 [Mycena galericulata]
MTIDIDSSNPPPEYDSPMIGAPQEKAATSSPRYVYYRVYALYGAIPAKTAFDPSNPFIGRIAARSVPPPHTVLSLKRCLVHAENFSDPTGLRTVLYLNSVATSRLSNTTQLTILGQSESVGGATPETAFALSVIEDLTVDEATAVHSINTPGSREDSRYLYYHLYTPIAEDTSKVAFNPDEPAIGRIERFRITPPLEPASIKRCIAKTEGKPIYVYADLYEDISATEAMSDGSSYASIQNETAGHTEERPMVLVQPERRQGLLNRPFKIISETYKYRVLLPVAVGQLGFTDGVAKSLGSITVYECRMQHQSAGNVFTGDVKFLDE